MDVCSKDVDCQVEGMAANEHDDHDNGTDDGPTEHEGEHVHDARGKAQGEESWVGKNIAQVTGDVIQRKQARY